MTDRRASLIDRRAQGRGPKDVNTPEPSAEGLKNPLTTAFRVTSEELKAIRIAAAKRHMTAAAYLRDVVIPIALKEAA